MRKALRKAWAVFELEMDISFPFPILECVFAIPILVASSSALGFIYGTYARSDLVPDFFTPENILRTIDGLGVHTFADALYSLGSITLFIVPMMVTFSLARSLETGTMKTLLSYPIGRRNLLIIKVGQAVILVWSAVTAGLFFAVFAFTPGTNDLSALVMMSASFLALVFAIVATTVLIAVVSKSAPVTAIIGTGLWFYLLYLAMLGTLSPVVRGVLNPTLMAVCLYGGALPFFPDITAADLVVSIVGALAIGALAFFLSLFVFDRREV